MSHAELPKARLWEGFEAYWRRLAAEGVLSGFGGSDRKSYREVSDAP